MIKKFFDFLEKKIFNKIIDFLNKSMIYNDHLKFEFISKDLMTKEERELVSSEVISRGKYLEEIFFSLSFIPFVVFFIMFYFFSSIMIYPLSFIYSFLLLYYISTDLKKHYRYIRVNNPPLKQRASKEPKNLVGCYFNSSVSQVNLLTWETRYRYYSTIFPVVDTINPLSMVGKLTTFG
jgi:hypothetical protein